MEWKNVVVSTLDLDLADLYATFEYNAEWPWRTQVRRFFLILNSNWFN